VKMGTDKDLTGGSTEVRAFVALGFLQGPKLRRPIRTAYRIPFTEQMDRAALLVCIAVYMVLRVV
jgi:hypothetical protein